jgi:LmbE family N-acetylglucosaminyl deacetylase
MKHLFLSPHPDDAALSCGGRIATLAQAGEPVEIYTLMAANMPPDTPQGEFVVEHVLRWNLGPDPSPGRRIEDACAAEVLGASLCCGDLADAIYRVGDDGRLLYPDLDALFGEIAPDDAVRARIEPIARALGPDVVLYAPLGAGHHVDHQAVRDVALVWQALHPGAPVLFYEEYPYTVRDSRAIEAARALLGCETSAEIYPVSGDVLETKIRAIACHVSQIPTFWAGVEAMADDVRQYAAAVGAGAPAERFWRPSAPRDVSGV